MPRILNIPLDTPFSEPKRELIFHRDAGVVNIPEFNPIKNFPLPICRLKAHTSAIAGDGNTRVARVRKVESHCHA